MYHLISNFNGVLLLGWGILHPVCASRQHFLAIVTSSIIYIYALNFRKRLHGLEKRICHFVVRNAYVIKRHNTEHPASRSYIDRSVAKIVILSIFCRLDIIRQRRLARVLQAMSRIVCCRLAAMWFACNRISN